MSCKLASRWRYFLFILSRDQPAFSLSHKEALTHNVVFAFARGRNHLNTFSQIPISPGPRITIVNISHYSSKKLSGIIYTSECKGVSLRMHLIVAFLIGHWTTKFWSWCVFIITSEAYCLYTLSLWGRINNHIAIITIERGWNKISIYKVNL